MQTRGMFFAALIAFGSAPGIHADTLVIEAVQQSAGLERPEKGQSMAVVEARFGAPREVIPAVGQPPITRWVYDGFTVYFEGGHVLRAVANR